MTTTRRSGRVRDGMAEKEEDSNVSGKPPPPKKTRSQVHTEDTDSRVVLDPQVDVLLDAKAEVAGLGEIAVNYRIRSV